MQNKKLKDGREDPEDDDMSEDDSTDEMEDPDVNSNHASDVIDEVTNKTFMSKLSIKRKDKEKVQHIVDSTKLSRGYHVSLPELATIFIPVTTSRTSFHDSNCATALNVGLVVHKGMTL